MSPPLGPLTDETALVSRCRRGNPEALAELRQGCHQTLVNILLSRGASRTEAEDLMADLWGECVPGPGDHPSLLEKFSGRCTLQGWIATVATNRWIDLKRRQERRGELALLEHAIGESNPVERLPAVSLTTKDEALVNLLRDSLGAAFALVPSESLVLLRLVYLHHLTQRELVRMLGWSESKVSRILSQAMRTIEQHTLKELKKRDAWLELTWQDFVDLCETHQIGFS